MRYDPSLAGTGQKAIGLLVVVALAACAEPSSSKLSATVEPSTETPSTIRAVGDQLAELRAATARFQNFEKARDGGYEIQLTGCMADAPGGMGFHYGKGSAINKLAPDIGEPEALMYEPQANGRYRLVGVEYLIPYTLHARSAQPPVLFGQAFRQNDVFQVWALHAWVWKHNATGMFEDWNPDVNCDAAPATSRVSHDH
jgi:hypothetical protein